MKTIFVAGAHGMVGSALARALEGKANLLTPSREELDLFDQREVHSFLKQERPDEVIVAAARVGGIHANNTYPADFLIENVKIAANVIEGSHLADIGRLLFLGSTCIYPREAPQPMREEFLLTGPLEPTNEPYALAKLMGIKLCESYRRQYGRDYISALPTNLYGPGDNYHREDSHVLPALLRRFHEAEDEVVLWGTGTTKREFLYVDDLAEACLFLLDNYHDSLPINIGSTDELTIEELAHQIAAVTGFKGEIVHDLSKPDGTPRKKTDTSRLSQLGWEATTSLIDGLKLTYEDFLTHQQTLRGLLQ